jgi:glucosamine--fructose-6-phosphate aminotransferase (isomerizing)
VNFPVALEGALKLKEISYIHAEGYPAAEMKHGPIALIDADMPVIFVAPQDEVYSKSCRTCRRSKRAVEELSP